jgi:hypothetical protein
MSDRDPWHEPIDEGWLRDEPPAPRRDDPCRWPARTFAAVVLAALAAVWWLL